MDYRVAALQKHREWRGKLELTSRAPVSNTEELSLAYTPGVAAPCLEIQKDIENSYIYTRRWNTVAVITDGTAVLGLGDIGPEAGMPVMEGKCCLFKEFADVDAIPLCIRSKDTDEIVRTVELLAGSFGGINLEDIAAPRCFEIERRLKEVCDIPIFHDDQHGTAVVVAAALLNALRVTKRSADVKIVINGAGAAGIAICKMLLNMGFNNILICDRAGIVNSTNAVNDAQTAIAKETNMADKSGNLADALIGADVFIGVSGPNALNTEMVKTMNHDAIVFACANPTPEIFPDDARAGGAAVVATGRSDFPNQINNVLVFPGIFRGTLDARAKDITEGMKIAAAHALAELITDDELNADYIIPSPFDKRVASAIAEAVKKAAAN